MAFRSFPLSFVVAALVVAATACGLPRGGAAPAGGTGPSGDDAATTPAPEAGPEASPPEMGAPEGGVPVASDGGGGGKGDAANVDSGGTTILDAQPDSSWTATSWSPVSFGVTTKDAGAGADIVIVYGGYTATDADSQGWVTEMALTRLVSLGVGHLYAVRGPKDADYASREIGNSELAAALEPLAASSHHIIVVAHSSGGFVADELFTFVSPTVMNQMAYFNLDGGSWALTDAMVSTMRGVYFCNAHDAIAGDSQNTSSDQSLHAMFAASHAFTVDADGSGCDVGAGWCLHDALITSRPHDPATYDLALDYTDFSGGRNVVTSYVDQAVTDGVL